MDFNFITETGEISPVIQVAVALRTEAVAREPERKRIMKEARLGGDEDLRKLMSRVRPPAWYAIVSCEECPQYSLVAANISAAKRFDCSACSGLASLVWIEEHAREKVTKMYDIYLDKRSAKVARGDDPWTAKAKVLHRKDVKRSGCKVKESTADDTCEWCRGVAI